MPRMSSLASWSYTSTATHWPLLGVDDWSRTATYGAPVAFACDYSGEATKMTDDRGEEFVSRMVLHTELATVKRGDFVALGAVTALDPTQYAEAFEVRAVRRYADTFEGKADDYRIAT